jgi:hypothetical protein
MTPSRDDCRTTSIRGARQRVLLCHGRVMAKILDGDLRYLARFAF